jgi:hypothetical protein
MPRFIPLLLVLILTGCPKVGPVLVPPEPSCNNACMVLEHYNCEEAKPTQIGPRLRSCTERCEQVEATGYMSLEPGCVTRNSTDLAAIRSRCGYRCEQGRP